MIQLPRCYQKKKSLLRQISRVEAKIDGFVPEDAPEIPERLWNVGVEKESCCLTGALMKQVVLSYSEQILRPQR